MKSANRVTGVAAIGLSLIYIFAFVYYGVFWNFPGQSDVQTKMNFLAEHQSIISAVSFITYILFGLVLSILVAGTVRCLQQAGEMQKSITGSFWVFVGWAGDCEWDDCNQWSGLCD
ncbi:hypothetical protein [Pseudoalteromonas xiamenensis]